MKWLSSSKSTSIAKAAERIAAGDLNVEITVKSDKDILAKNMKQVVDNLHDLIAEMEHMSKEHQTGDIDVMIAEDKFQGVYKIMAKAINDMVKSHIDVKKKAMACVAEFAKGNFEAELEKFPGKKAFINENIEKLRSNIKEFIHEMDNMSQEQDAGDIEVFVPEEKFQGSYKVMAKGVNDMVKGHISVKKKAMDCVAEFAKGNFTAELERFPGKKVFINDNIEALRKNLNDVNIEINKLILASSEGKLNARADATAFHGDWALLIKGLNGLIDTIIEPVLEAAAVLDELSKGNLQTGVKGNYQGDHAKIKDSLNSAIESFNKVLTGIDNAAEQVSTGTKQLSDASLVLSQGATEQASAIEELTASLEEISSQTKLNAGSANEANSISETAKANTEQGNAQMKEMLRAMNEINEASNQISKIIKVIDEIAFQTNKLALNAAVEAARAGQHGRGFAVVAEEVRNLAARCSDAAKETTAVIEGSIKKVEGGTRMANQTAIALGQIVEGVAKVANIVSNIAVASNEQATGIAQINQGIIQVSQVVQTNTATSEESASASEELASQAEMLRQQVSGFKLQKTDVSTSPGEQENISSKVGMLQNLNNRKKQLSVSGRAANSTWRIEMNDNEFGKY